MSLLLPPGPEGGEDGEEATNDAEGGLKKDELNTGEKHESVDDGSDEIFPLHIDQEVSTLTEAVSDTARLSVRFTDTRRYNTGNVCISQGARIDCLNRF